MAKVAIERHLSPTEKLLFHFERVAILPEDVELYQLPTRPTKKKDPRSGKFKGESVELDAMDMRIVKQRVKDCILQNLPPEMMEEALQKEQDDKDRIAHLVRGLRSDQLLALGSGED